MMLGSTLNYIYGVIPSGSFDPSLLLWLAGPQVGPTGWSRTVSRTRHPHSTIRMNWILLGWPTDPSLLGDTDVTIFNQIFIVVLQWRLCSFLSTIVIAYYYSVATGDVSRSFPLQFGSISPGFMNGMQVYICCMFCRWYNFFTNYNLTKAVPFLLNETITYAAH